MTADKMSNNPDDGDGNLRERNTPLALGAIIGCAKMNDILGAMARVRALRGKPNLRRKRLTSGDEDAKVRKRCWFETGSMALLPDKDADWAYQQALQGAGGQATIYHGQGCSELIRAKNSLTPL
jgi:hypothetical protein